MEQEAKKKHTILVCLSSSPSNERVIRAAAKLCRPETDRFEAIYVGRSENDIQEHTRLRENIRLASEAGAGIRTIISGEVVQSIAEYARTIGATDLFIGYSLSGSALAGPSIPEQLTSYLPDTDIFVIPDRKASRYAVRTKISAAPQWNSRDFLLVIGIMGAATVLSFYFDQSQYSNSNIVTIYILAVLSASAVTSNRMYGILAAILYILLFNFLFIDPRFTLLVYDSTYLVTYFVTIIAAVITGSLAARMKQSAALAAENAYQAKVLLETSNQLEKAQDRSEMVRIVCVQLSDLLRRTVHCFKVEDGEPVPVLTYGKNGEQMPALTDADRSAILWAWQNNHHSGAFTSHDPDAPCQFFSIHSDGYKYGVLGIDMDSRRFTEYEKTLLLSIMNEFTMSLDNERIQLEKQETQISAEKEHLRAGLLRSISHDLRTPLTSICGNASHLASHGRYLSDDERQKLYEDIQDNSFWLAGQMENILSLTKLENDPNLRITVENVWDVIEESRRHLSTGTGNHKVILERGQEDLYAEMDPKMIVLVLVNLMENAFKYTPDGSTVTVSCRKDGDRICVEVADDGNGIPPEERAHIFELYYTGHHTLADSCRSMGIGLNLCEMILHAHGQTIEADENLPHGAVFRFYLKAREVKENE